MMIVMYPLTVAAGCNCLLLILFPPPRVSLVSVQTSQFLKLQCNRLLIQYPDWKRKGVSVESREQPLFAQFVSSSIGAHIRFVLLQVREDFASVAQVLSSKKFLLCYKKVANLTESVHFTTKELLMNLHF